MGYEGSFITMKLIWHSYLVLSLDNCVHETPTETGLTHLELIRAQAPLDPTNNGVPLSPPSIFEKGEEGRETRK